MEQTFFRKNNTPSVSRVFSRLFTLILGFCLITTIVKGQYIPDANFAKGIRRNCPECIDAQNNLTATAKNIVILLIGGNDISDLSGIEGFDNLRVLNCVNNNLSILPPLPKRLEHLTCYENNLSCLPDLPPSVKAVTVDYGGVNASQSWITCVPNNGNPELKVYNYLKQVVNAPFCSDTIFPPTVFSKPIVTNVSCNGTNTGKIVFPATGTPGTTYTISPNMGTQSPIGTFNNLPAGAYVIKASNSNFCTAYTFNVTVTQAINPTKNYRLVNRRSGLVLDVPTYTGAGGNGVPVFQNTLTSLLNQTWRFTDLGNNYFRITFNRSNLGLRSLSSTENSTIFQDTYVAGGTSDWLAVCLGGGYYRLQNRANRKYLSVSNNSTTARANAVIQTLNTTNLSQQWQIVEIGSSTTQNLVSNTDVNTAAEGKRADLTETEIETGNIEQKQTPSVHFTLFPNPATNEAFINIQDYEGQAVSIVLSDVSGKTIVQDRLESASSAPYRLDLKPLQSGLFFVKVQGQDGSIATHKLQILR